MTLKFDGNGLKFGRTWVDRIMGKVDKDQGVANAGKVLGIGSDGIVTPVEQTGGGSGVTYETYQPSSAEELYNNVDRLKTGTLFYYNATIRAYARRPSSVVDVNGLSFVNDYAATAITFTRMITGQIISHTLSNGQYVFKVIVSSLPYSSSINGSITNDISYTGYEIASLNPESFQVNYSESQNMYYGNLRFVGEYVDAGLLNVGTPYAKASILEVSVSPHLFTYLIPQ